MNVDNKVIYGLQSPKMFFNFNKSTHNFYSLREDKQNTFAFILECLFTKMKFKSHLPIFHIYLLSCYWLDGKSRSICRVSQDQCARLRESIPYVKVYRYNSKHLYPKLNGYGDNDQRKVRSSCGSTYCTLSADALHIHCACRWDWNAVNIMPACPCKVLGTLRTTTALMRVFM